MIFSQDDATGQVTLSPEGPFATGSYVTLKLTFTTGEDGLAEGARLRPPAQRRLENRAVGHR
ncbi:MAG: hypothetical protein OXI23_07755, partial [Gemmatimonadota bacterium]|nr:hypothetical protein [Gemmatimonadota bacterium]